MDKFSVTEPQVVELAVLDGLHAGARFLFHEPQRIRIGTSSTCELVLRGEPGLQAVHAELSRGLDALIVQALGPGAQLRLGPMAPITELGRNPVTIGSGAELVLSPGGPRLRVSLGLAIAFGHYLLTGVLGEGGMGQVFAARRTGPRGIVYGEVAVKLLRPEISRLPGIEAMILDEARIASAIRHPNVVRLMEVAEHQGLLYLELEYLHGLTFSALVKLCQYRGIALPMDLCAALCAQACAGLHAAHEVRSAAGVPMNVIHRDISPSNLILTTDGTVKVIDFGIARAQDRLQESTLGLFKGKLAYAAPEQLLLSRDLDRRVDVFALGVVLHELCSGTRLFARTTREATMQAVLHEAIALPPNMPPLLSQLLMRALDKDPARRLMSAAEFEAGLRQVVHECSGRFERNEQQVEFFRSNGLSLAGEPAALLKHVPPLLRSMPETAELPQEMAALPSGVSVTPPTMRNVDAMTAVPGPAKSTARPALESPPVNTRMVHLPVQSFAGDWKMEASCRLWSLELNVLHDRQPRILPFAEVANLLPAPLVCSVEPGALVLEVPQHPTGSTQLGMYVDAAIPQTRMPNYWVNRTLTQARFEVGHRRIRVQQVQLRSIMNDSSEPSLTLPVPELGLAFVANGAPDMLIALYTTPANEDSPYVVCVTATSRT